MTRPAEGDARGAWRKSEKGCWSVSLGTRGCRVRVFQREPGGEFSRETWIVRRSRNQAALGTTSRVEARRLAERFLREVKAGDVAAPLPALTLDALWTRYKTEAPAYRMNTERTRAEKEARARLLIRGLGASTA
jgi:hypothetical protein